MKRNARPTQRLVAASLGLFGRTLISGRHSYHIEVTVEKSHRRHITLLEVEYPSASFGADTMERTPYTIIEFRPAQRSHQRAIHSRRATRYRRKDQPLRKAGGQHPDRSAAQWERQSSIRLSSLGINPGDPSHVSNLREMTISLIVRRFVPIHPTRHHMGERPSVCERT